MATITIPAPSDKQRLFLSDRHKFVAFGGARGGGKSWGVRVKALLLGYSHAGINQVIIRRSFPELLQNHIKPMLAMLPQGAYRYNDSRKEVTLPNGSHIYFRYCSNDADLLNFQGAEYDVMFIDEATQLTEYQFKTLTACVRGVNEHPKRVYLTCNPGGVGHGWVKRLFVDRHYETGERAEDYSFIQSLVGDNKALMESDPDYIAFLEALPPKLKDAWLYGKWDIFEGQFFEDFVDDPNHYEDRQYTNVIKPFKIPSYWTIYRAFDWGYAKPFACEWIAVDRDGRAYVFLEFYGCTQTPNEGVKMTPQQVFGEIARIEREHPMLAGRQILGIADPAIWDAQTGESIADTAAKCGVYFSKGDHKRIAGWMQMHYRFSFDENGFPMMYVFTNCKHCIRTIPLLQYSETVPEDLATDDEDHIADSLRYFCMANVLAAPKAKIKDDWANNPAHLYLDIKREDLVRR